MRSDDNMICCVNEWLQLNGYSQAWLAKEMDISSSLLSQIFSGDRCLQTVHIERISEITKLSISDLFSLNHDGDTELNYSIRGEISTPEGKRGLEQLLLDSEHYVHLTLNKCDAN